MNEPTEGMITETELAGIVNAYCTGECVETECVWCRIYRAVTALRAIRTELGMRIGSTEIEILAHVEELHSEYRSALGILREAQNVLHDFEPEETDGR